jgi:hypothetical protein
VLGNIAVVIAATTMAALAIQGTRLSFERRITCHTGKWNGDYLFNR